MFGRPAVHQVEVPSRDLILEVCECISLLIANTFMPGSAEEKVTLAEPGSPLMGANSEIGYKMSELLLCDKSTLCKCVSVGSIISVTVATDHYLAKAVLLFD